MFTYSFQNTVLHFVSKKASYINATKVEVSIQEENTCAHPHTLVCVKLQHLLSIFLTEQLLSQDTQGEGHRNPQRLASLGAP